MATAEQIKGLVKAYAGHDNERFKTIVLQIAAHEAKLGHTKFARDLKALVDKIDVKRANVVQLNAQNPMLQLNITTHSLAELIVGEGVYSKIKRILNEYLHRNRLRAYGLANRRKILIVGSPGTGKTLTASVIASELSLPLYTVQMDKLVTKYMGETSVKLRQVFDSIESLMGVYLFDEFDAIGADRGLDNEVGEMRRILNSFLQFLEQDSSDSIIIAATNNPKMLDQALFRRFDDVMHYSLPTTEEIDRLFALRLKPYDRNFKITNQLIETASGLSHAEISRVCEDAIKESILNDQIVTQQQVMKLIKERCAIYNKREA